MSAQKTPITRTLANYVNQQVVKQLAKLGLSLPGTVASVDGSIVTVNFQVMGLTLPQVTMPLAGPEYIRYPTQVGDKGFCVSASFYLGAMSGLGSGTAGPTRRGNLSMLVFYPIGNANWSAPDDTQAVVIYGPNGVILRDTGKKTTVTLTPTGVDVKAQHQVTIEADTEVQATVGSNSVLLNTSEVELAVGSNSVLLNATEAVITIGSAILTLTASGLVSSVPITAPTFLGNLTATTASIGGKNFATHTHNVAGVTTGSSTVVSGGPN